MTSIGETLRRERMQKGLDLQQVSESTKIGTRMLQAMEQDDFGKLPGGVFTRSFIKQYAAALGLNPAVLGPQLDELTANAEEPKTEARKDIIPERSHYSLSDYNASRNPGSYFMSLMWVVLAVAVGGGVYYLLNRPQPEESKAPVIKSETPLAKVESVTPALIPAVSSGAVQVEISANEKTWISLTVDGEPQFIGDMKPNEKRTVQGANKVKLVTGNAGALALLLNGKAINPVGAEGQVRTVEFTISGAHIVSPTPPKPAPLP